ncbi:MAG: cellulase family glycosylhydrolase [Chloroflexota bacterium]
MAFTQSTNARHRRILLVCFFLLVTALTNIAPSGMPVRAQKSAPNQFASSDFEAVWQRADGPIANGQVNRSWLWGPAPGLSLNETFAGATSGKRLVQYFDKARMELNPAVTDPTSQWRVSTGLLVSEMVEGKIQAGTNQFTQTVPSAHTVAGDDGASGNPRYADFRDRVSTKAADKTGADVTDSMVLRGGSQPAIAGGVKYATYIPETGHNIPDVFWRYMGSNGTVLDANGATQTSLLFDWLYVMGYPIAEPVWVSLTIDGKQTPTLIQLFQRRVLTYVPSYKEGWQVQMGNVGQHYYDWRYNTSVAPAPAIMPPAVSTLPALQPATGGFVGISGDSFTYAGTEVKLKGTNYWLSQAPFVGTWSEWNGPRALQELEKAHQLGINTIRIGIPYDHRDTRDVVWGNTDEMVKVGPWIKNQMTQLLQIASGYGMKVIFVLFEWYDKYPDKGSREERTNIAYLEGIVGTFANDDRVLAWDLHNEPDFYEEWQGGKQEQVINWLQRMAGAVRFLDNRHPITVGVGNYESLWTATANGTFIMSFVDFAAFHSYDAGNLSRQIKEIKARTDKPILLEEMGWPTGLGSEAPRENAVFDESTQSFLYKSMLGDSKQADIAGVVQWTLWDYWGGSTNLVPGHERYFGLVRPDGSFKPAASIFQSDYKARDLPSDTITSVPLDTSDKPNIR